MCLEKKKTSEGAWFFPLLETPISLVTADHAPFSVPTSPAPPSRLIHRLFRFFYEAKKNAPLWSELLFSSVITEASENSKGPSRVLKL